MTLTDARHAMLEQLKTELADLAPASNGYGLHINGVNISTQANRLMSGFSVIVHTGYSLRTGQHRFTKVDNVPHLAKNIRRIVAEHTEYQVARKESARRMEAQLEREAAARQQVEAAVAAANEGRGTFASKLTVEELMVNDERRYFFDFNLHGLTETQALAILAIAAHVEEVRE